jgi:cyclopropane fatty-acyl-phospholipid synthase-like methyltransferase
MAPTARLKPTLRRIAQRRVRNLPAARRLRFELTTSALERFAAGRRLTVLDAGCGEGLLAETLALRHPDWEIVGADVADEQLEQARSYAAERGIANVRFVRADLTRNLGESLYDAVLAIECLEEITDDEGALASMARALRNGGLLIAHVPERDWTPLLRGSARTWKDQVRHGYSPEELQPKLEEAGLSVAAVRPTSRGVVRLAQELRDRIKTRGFLLQLLALPASGAAVRLERLGVTWGAPRALFVTATRP